MVGIKKTGGVTNMKLDFTAKNNKQNANGGGL